MGADVHTPDLSDGRPGGTGQAAERRLPPDRRRKDPHHRHRDAVAHQCGEPQEGTRPSGKRQVQGQGRARNLLSAGGMSRQPAHAPNHLRDDRKLWARNRVRGDAIDLTFNMPLGHLKLPEGRGDPRKSGWRAWRAIRVSSNEAEGVSRPLVEHAGSVAAGAVIACPHAQRRAESMASCLVEEPRLGLGIEAERVQRLGRRPVKEGDAGEVDDRIDAAPSQKCEEPVLRTQAVEGEDAEIAAFPLCRRGDEGPVAFQIGVAVMDRQGSKPGARLEIETFEPGADEEGVVAQEIGGARQAVKETAGPRDGATIHEPTLNEPFRSA
ncbi:hypothetical protein CHELA17_40055 [Chelatococcus asaccharovorans]|nr:hypothetical protein CHELA17_40055 [Chelatococcus asaccharovorans]